MKKFLLTLAAIPAATLAVQASAQTYVGSDADLRLQTRVASLEQRYQAALQAGVLSGREQTVIGRQLAQLRQMHQQYSYNGLSSGERRNLQQQIRTVRDQLRTSADARWANRYGWNDRDLETGGYAYGQTSVQYDQYGRPLPTSSVYYDQYGRPVATTNQGYDRYGRPVATPGYTYDRYGRAIPNSGYYGQGGYSQGGYGQGGPYEPVYQPRNRNGGIGNVLGGVLGSVLGGGGGAGGILGGILSNGGLRVGDLITSVLGGALGRASPLGFQDRGDVYFRTDGERVYEIDARTNTVVRVHPAR